MAAAVTGPPIPPAAPAPPYGLPPAGPTGGYPPSYASGYPGQAGAYAATPPPKKSHTPLIITLIAVGVIVIALVAWLVIRGLNSPTPTPPTTNPPTATQTTTQTATTGPTGTATATTTAPPTTSDCVYPPSALLGDASLYTIPADGRVHSGGLSYPVVGAPWYCPFDYGSDSAIGQGVMQYYVLPEISKTSLWGPNLIIGQSRSSNTSAQAVAESVIPYTVNNWYSDKNPSQNITSSHAVNIGGTQGWTVVATISYSDSTLYDTYDTNTVYVLPVSGGGFGVILASIPETTPQSLQDQIDAALADIQVG